MNMLQAISTIEIGEHIFAAHSPTDVAYLQEAKRFWRWYQQRYARPNFNDAFTAAIFDRYLQWCIPQLRPATLQRRQIALQWFVDVAMKRSERLESS